MEFRSIILVAFATISTISAEVLTPPYFNLAEGSTIEATATCGVNIASPKEQFCRLTGASANEVYELSGSPYYSRNSQIIAGQLCDFCVAEGTSEASAMPSQVHSAQYAIDGTERWWQSPPLSRGSRFNDVNLTVNLGQEFHVAYVFITMGNSPRPGVWTLERSIDDGKTWLPWQYFADSAGDCQLFFNKTASKKPVADTDVICTTAFSKIVPLESGEIAVSLVQDRPGSTNFSHSPSLQSFTKATNIRMSLQRTRTLQGHLMQLQLQDPTVTRRYFYSVKDINIGGRCVCNGHADACDKKDQFKLACECQHNTCGDNCDRCCEPFVQKKWQAATNTDANVCEPCQCYGHATECVYDEDVDRLGLSIDTYGKYEGGGVCQNCTDNTEGINCDKCVHGYYRPPGKNLTDKDVCQRCACDLQFTTGNCDDETGICECLEQFTGVDCRECAYGYYDPPECKPCDCFLNGTYGNVCEVGGGQCPCKVNFDGADCGQCADGFWNFPECEPCTCAGKGALDLSCDKLTGQCNCDFAFSGKECDTCQTGFFDYPKCTFCDCDTTGTEPEICHQTSGQCICKDNYTGKRCDQCAPGFYLYPVCSACDCELTGTINGDPTCDDQGQCQCLSSFGGKKCDSCAPGYHKYPACKSCDCDLLGGYGQSCDDESAQCDCRSNFIGLKCDSCAPNFYNFPTCEACLCNPAGAMPVDGYPLGGCGSFDDGYTLCECKPNVEGHICDQCKPGFYNLAKENADGCEACTCHLPGTLLGENMCDPVTGECLCKVNVNSDWCEACIAGTYNLQESSVFGCEDCDCDMGGAIHGRCHSTTGQCSCRPRVEGRACNKPIANHYFPTLHQMKYEMEDGFNPSDDSDVRSGYNMNDFPDFSWRGYAIFSRIQPEVRVVATIDKPSSLFKLIFRYMNRNLQTVNAEVTLSPVDPSSEEQSITVSFPPTGSTQPDFVTTDTQLVLDKGKWIISVATDSDLDVDYLVLLPQVYYSGSNLQDRLRNPCMVNSKQECLHYTYLDLSKFNQLDGAAATRPDGEEVLLETNRDILIPLKFPDLVLLENDQREVVFNMSLESPGKYVFVVGYMSSLNVKQTLTVNMTPEGGNTTVGKVIIYECEYSSLCRQVVIDMDNGEQVLDTPTANITVSIIAGEDAIASIGYISAIPQEKWKDEMIKAQVMCVRSDEQCVESSYPLIADSVVMNAPSNANDSSLPFPDSGVDRFAKLDHSENMVITFNNLTSNSYAIVVRYYQAGDVGFPVNLTVDVNGVMYSGYFDASYCPNTAGCNSIVTFDDIQIKNQIIDVLSRDAVITIKSLPDDGNTVWIDFVQMIPTNDVQRITSDLELLNPYDLSGRYISECTGENFFIDAEQGQISPFCRSSIFSVTTEYNNGALSCDCDALGSESFQCSEFGGQCRCKPNVIGRTCTACAHNYYGFPDCKPCNCPATCNAVTGACECPKRTTGPQCDQCVPQTYGYDRTIGCMDCKCQPEGVLNGNLSCDLDTGVCDCKPNVVGRQCDACMNGHWNYPSCDSCDCDPAGTTEIICDSETSQCSCKLNTGGDTCGTCQPGTYNLEARNHEGCTKCFCFGITFSCQSSSMLKAKVMNMSGFDLINANGTAEIVGNDSIVTAKLNDSAAQQIAMYWLAPEVYLGNKLTSYGGQIRYSVSNQGVTPGVKPNLTQLPGPDVQISGKGLVLVYTLLSPILDEEISVDIIESSWRHAASSDMVTREQLMKVISAVDEILIKANYYTNIPEVTLANVVLDIAIERNSSSNSSDVSESFSSDIALSVEMCQCPPNYAGTSCEDCAGGFYRKFNAAGAFVCVPCECNGHSNTCDKETGICSECEGHTEGDHCEKCKLGYTGDPEQGGQCTICACPMPIESNNFAKNCELSSDGSFQTVQCDCVAGYMPPYCDWCGPGYYGSPRNTSGGRCIPCECNGNIDTSDPASCDGVTGACLVCINNTQGERCEECADFYWGDAIDAKNCQKCDCDELGTESCDKETGKCMCKNNVVGDRCDQCAEDTWGFHLGNGCSFCNCSIASNSSQCDIYSGDCTCQPGTSGKQCNSCLPQHWNFTTEGCQSCECALDGAVGCSVETGICQCLQGVTGERCDRCADRWVLIPSTGCEACDNCVHTLLDDTDSIQFDIANASESLRIINIGFEARKRLELLNETIPFIQMQLDNLPRRSLDPDEIDLLSKELQSVQEMAANTLKQAQQVETISSSTTKSYGQLWQLMNDTSGIKEDAMQQVNDVLAYIRKRYDDILSSEDLSDVNRLLRDAQAMLANMQERQLEFDDLLDDANSSYISALETLGIVEGWSTQNSNLTERFMTISDSLEDMKERLLDLQDQANDALNRSATAEEHLSTLKELIEQLQQSTVDIKSLKDQLEKTIVDALLLTTEADSFISNATATFQNMEEQLTVLDAMVDELNSLHTNLTSGNAEAQPKVDEAIAHADSLKVQAVDLSNLLNKASEAAIKAANAYKNIVTSISEAKNASQDAFDMALKATQQSADISNNTEQVKADSLDLLQQAKALKNETSNDLKTRLDNSLSALAALEDQNLDIEQKYTETQFNIGSLRTTNREDAEAARELARSSQTKAEDAVANVSSILDSLALDQGRVNQIPTFQQEMAVNILKIKANMDSIRSLSPNVTSLTESLLSKKPNLTEARERLNASISILQQRIENARAIANRIKVALKSDENTTVQLRAPEDFVESLQQQTEISLFFQTLDPNGLLLYIGPQGATSSGLVKRAFVIVEFLAIEMVDGHVVWKYNLGSSTAVITSNNTYNDGKWHQVIATRKSKDGTLTVRTHQEADDEVKGAAGGVYNQLDLIPETTYIYAAGVPDDFTLPEEVVNRHFIGAIDDYSYSENKIRLGLWNFIDGQANDKPVLDRGGQLPPQVIDSVRFVASSESYITLDKGLLTSSKKSDMRLKFKTFNKDGILFFLGQDRTGLSGKPDYFKVYISGGQVYVTFELGGGEITATVNQSVSNGTEFELHVERQNNIVRLTLGDQVVTEHGPTTSTELNIGANPELHLGGIPKDSMYNGDSIIDHPYFDGCISDLNINQNPINILGDYLAKVGTVQCTELVKRSITFQEAPADGAGQPDEGYVHVIDDIVPVGENFTVSMRIKTLATDGLLFYTTSSDDMYAFSIAMVNGTIKVVNTAGLDSSGNPKRNELATVKAYNDGAWHHMSVVKESLVLRIVVDDNDYIDKESDHRGKKTKTAKEFGYYLGGLSQATVDSIVDRNNSATWQRFIGCMSDVFILNLLVDFSTSPETGYADYSTCPVEDPDDQPITTTAVTSKESLQPPTLAPIADPKPCVLPKKPDVENVVEQGTRFGLSEDSRYEFSTIAGFQTDIRKELRRNNNVRLQIKTFAMEGMIWFVGDFLDTSKSTASPDYSAIYLDKGKVVYKCNLGTGSGTATSQNAINDGEWHTIEINRQSKNKTASGYLLIDQETPIEVQWPGTASSLNFQLPLYVGGLNMSDGRYGYMAQKIGMASAASLVGCIDQLEFRGKDAVWVPYGSVFEPVDVEGCFENQEDGAYIPVTGGSLALGTGTVIGLLSEIEISVRPRSDSGVVFLVWGGGDYLAIELYNGQVIANVNNGAGDIEVAAVVDDICDGQWRKIKVIKNENILTLIVTLDTESPAEALEAVNIGGASSKSADTNSPVYIGGIPTQEVIGSRYKPKSMADEYVGCIRSVRVGGRSFNISRGRKIGDVAKTCPTT